MRQFETIRSDIGKTLLINKIKLTHLKIVATSMNRRRNKVAKSVGYDHPCVAFDTT
jgi:hypothetical protein